MTLLAFHDPLFEDSQNSTRPIRFGSDLSSDALNDFDRLGRLSTLPRATMLFKEDDPCRSVIFLRSGEVKLSTTSSRGRILILKIARAGELLGLAAAISGSRHEMTAEALLPTAVKTIPGDEFLRFMDRHRGARISATRVLAEDCKSAFKDVRSIAYSSASERLAAILLNWTRSAVAPKPRLSFNMTLTHDELGSLAGVSRETVTRVLSGFQKKKLIAIHGAAFLILEPARLAAIFA